MELSDVRKVAELSRLSLNDHELQTFGQQLTAILDYVKLLDDVDIDGVQPMPHAIELQNVFREDLNTPSLDRAAALSNAPKTDGSFFLVPKILEDKGF
jgi:aspartyl-tRNA(Asn)/glutamyl-tRNA(Gln) amidotransferase subunit C